MKLIDCIDTQAARLAQAGLFFGHGTTNAFDEAMWLALWRLGLPLDTLDEHEDRELTEAEVASISALIDERITTRKPAAYLTGEAWLQGVPFTIDERAIVPRSFIAELIADASIDPWLNPDSRRVLDLCTGNGSLAVLAAMAWPDVDVDALDIDTHALAVAKLNVERHNLALRIRLLQGDGLGAVIDQRTGPYDLILCNPPYVNSASMAALPAEYRAEPELALAGGSDGMDFIREMLRAAPAALADDGVLVLEIGNERAHFEAAFPRLEVVWMDTSSGSDQVLLVTKDQLL
ncbi:50S ribosomal protein L3 N(5)-glutamine methyltransferase [Pelomonas cellulosilytica]|uniref:50S ribosomal protein L3 N(5)-glutamine methyltransferase n=1 Tax=Pelomonas cellulosilytica TaxID=2906762 RepID=A0ABS8XT61_9BURK|nr:50S ribosomal protein L3 N(5)-glutamine methyltransferase [Pelomonas sp. P8]MCE4555909.1 50S ribosomal protein L3 N(5)-glutamine methyltransferase [Pelomonas sp. P8]